MKRATSKPGDSKSALTPELLFPEFQGKAEWRLRKLGELFSQREEIGRTDLRLLSLMDKEGIIPQEDSNRKNNANVDRSKYLRVVPGDIAYNTMRMWEGRSALSKIEGVVSPAYTVCAPNADADGRFFSYYFKTPQLIAQFARYSQGLVKDTLNLKFEAFARILAATPSPAEQQKIADCLSSLDELIAAESRKLDTLKARKKGLMQRLFPCEGENTPRLRFPEFRDAGAWESIPLGKIAEIKLGKMLDGKKHTTGRLLPYLNNISVRWNAIDISNLPQMYFEDDELDRFGLKAGDVVVCEGGEPGRAAVWDGNTPNLKFQKAVHRVRFGIPFSPHLLVQYLEAIAGTPPFEKLFTGGGIKHLTRETFAKLEVPLISIGEQQHLSTFLTSVEELIAAQNDRISSLRTHKQGLMQQLFPATGEATA